MALTIKETVNDDPDFIMLCKKLDSFQSVLAPERSGLGFSSLNGLDRIQKVFIVYDKDQAVACAAMKTVDESKVELARVYTSDAYRGQGLATQLLEKAIAYARSCGYQKIILDTWRRNTTAQSLYRRLGFAVVPMFGLDTLQNAFSQKVEDKLDDMRELLVFMELDISSNQPKTS